EDISLYDVLGADGSGFHLQKDGYKGKHGEGEYDLFHSNSVEWMRYPDLERRDPLYRQGNVLVSLRHQDALAVVDMTTRRLGWSWGQGEVSGPHDATVLPNGHFLLLDNGLGRGWSRAIELDPLTKRIVWQYRARNQEEFYTASRGSEQRLPNGNTLMTNSDHGE